MAPSRRIRVASQRGRSGGAALHPILSAGGALEGGPAAGGVAAGDAPEPRSGSAARRPGGASEPPGARARRCEPDPTAGDAVTAGGLTAGDMNAGDLTAGDASEPLRAPWTRRGGPSPCARQGVRIQDAHTHNTHTHTHTQHTHTHTHTHTHNTHTHTHTQHTRKRRRLRGAGVPWPPPGSEEAGPGRPAGRAGSGRDAASPDWDARREVPLNLR